MENKELLDLIFKAEIGFPLSPYDQYRLAHEQLDLVLKIRNDCTLDEALIAMQAFILYHDAELKRRLEEAKE